VRMHPFYTYTHNKGCNFVVIAKKVNLRETELLVKTLTGMTTDVYPRENCIAPAIGELSFS